MRKRFYKIISFCIAFVIMACSCSFIPCVNVYAKPKTYYSWDEVRKDATSSIMYLLSQMGCIFKDYNFVQYVQNLDEWENYWNEDNISFDVDTQRIVAQDKFCKWLKTQAEEYAEQNEPYRIMTTTPFHELPYSSFSNQKNIYDTIKNLIYDSSFNSTLDVFVSSAGRVNNEYRNTISISFYDNDTDIGYVSNSKTSFSRAQGYSFSKWTNQSSNKRIATIVISADDEPISTVADFISLAREHANYASSRTGWDFYYHYYNFPDSISFVTSSSMTPTSFKGVTDTRYALSSYDSYKVTPSLEHYRVFATKDDFMDYTLGKRKVYYTSDWYNKEPGSISVDLSKLEDNVSDINKALEKLLDKIDDNTEESKIEELLKQILEELQNGSSGGDSGNTGGNTGGSTGGDSSGGGSVDLSGLSGYFESILDYLDKILQLQYIQTITQSEKDKFKEDTEKLLDENKSTFMEIANEMGKKFPFCIPADLAHLFSKLSGSSDAQTQALLNNSNPDYLMAVASGGGSSSGGSSGDIALASLGDSEVSVMAFDSDSGVSVLRSSMDAPYFELPIIIESFGIDEKIEVDLEPFQPISTFSRSMFSVLFAVALIKFTIHLIPLLSSSTD